MKFVHLHNHTHYSLLDGLPKIKDFVAEAKSYDMNALAITDHGSMYGVIEFYKECLKQNIKPIIGCEFYLARRRISDKNSNMDARPYHLILLAKNNIGYKNLLKLTSIAHLQGFYYKPRIDFELLEKYHNGLICSTACLNGQIPKTILSGDTKGAEELIKKYANLFGRDNFYLEMQYHPNEKEQIKVNEAMSMFSKKLDIPLLATNDVHYLKPEDKEAQDILMCLQSKKKIDDKDRMSLTDFDLSFRSPEQMTEGFKDYPDAISNTSKVADMCNVEIELNKILLPHFELPEGKTDNSYLRELCEEGLKYRYNGKVTEKIRQQLDYEFSIIEKTGFASYFLIVADFVNWAKKNKIVVGPGRGSAAGSIVSYLLNITDIDPLKYGLIFERFLNPDRISMPDIDMDFADTRRNEIIKYVENKYGKDRVAQIITFGTLAARAAIRDVGRVLGYSYNYCDKIAKMIPQMASFKEALIMSPELKDAYNNDPQAKVLIDYAKKLEGVARHHSMHACGVVISKDPLTDIVPLQYASSSDQTIISQYSLHPIEDIGLLKMDFLGLSNLTIIENVIEIIEKIHGIKFDLKNIDLTDKKTFELLQRGQTTGVFQLESSGMKRYLKQLKPTEFEDIIAMVSLYRPGPMQFIPDFINGKHGRRKIVYDDYRLKPILQNTYGIAIYQEQVMDIAKELAGFTYAEADVLRKAVGKKIKELLEEQKEKLINGMIKNGITKKVAEKIWKTIEPFASYGFNKSHATCYAMIAFQTAYFKANYPAEFMAALLTADQNDIEKVAFKIKECENMGIEVLAPDINRSFSTFTVLADELKEGRKKIRFGLNAIKNVGNNIVKAIIKERKQNGEFQSIEDFLSRIQDKDLNKKSLESLIKSGAMNALGEQNLLLKNIDKLLEFNRNQRKESENGQFNIFSGMSNYEKPKIRLEQYPPVDSREKLSWEKQMLGLYITGHPFKAYEKHISDRIKPITKVRQLKKEQVVELAGIINSIQKVFTKNNERMLFVTIEDSSAQIEVIVFPKLCEEYLDILVEDNIVSVKGKLNFKDDQPKILAESFSNIDSNTNSIEEIKPIEIEINSRWTNRKI
ncbi:MAG TPA: DNA polymerase III subunit alpha [bacterium]|jgi:DNA polymerase-3 subunit alpha|nr:DNA polymerase III subunit alpha [bacterium]HOG37877.1 DNA polymerase III subunit alpha [bacterium]HQI03093.1 DNA polymerase III subunit alpha [bacterium]